MDEAPDFDDLMEEAMMQDEQPPNEEDHDYEMMLMMQEEEEEENGGNERKQQEPNKNSSVPQVVNATVPNTTTTNPIHDDDVSMTNGETSPVRRRPIVRNDTEDAFSFERYTSGSVWRREKTDSPERSTLRATEWKKKDCLKNGATTIRGGNLSNGSLLSMPPEAQLLRHYHNRNLVTSKAILHKIPNYTVSRQKLPHKPVEGTVTRTITLAEGNQRYVKEWKAPALSKESLTGRPSGSTSGSSAGLFARVQAQRRQRQHERLHNATLHPATASPQQSNNNNNNHLWVDAHAPRSFGHLLSDDRTNREVIRALRAWDTYVFHTQPPPPRPNFGGNKTTTTTISSPNPKTSSSSSSPTKTTNHRDKRPEENRRVLLLSGSPGVGKTTLAHIAARHCGYRPMEVNGSDDRSAAVLTDRVVRAMESTTLHSFTSAKAQPNCLILDEIDGADANGAIQALVDIIKAEIPSGGATKKGHSYLRRPIIFICNNKYAPALRPLLPFCVHFNVEAPTPARLVERLRSVLKEERLSLIGGSSLLHQLVAVSGGDIRYCLFALQFAAARAKKTDNDAFADISSALTQSLNGGGLKDTQSDVLSVVTSVFQKKKPAKVGKSRIAREAAEKITDLDHIEKLVTSYGDNSKLLDLLFLNAIQISFIDPTFDRCAAVYEWMSQADTFRSSTSTSALTNSSMHYAMQAKYIPTTAGVLHCLCRVEQRQKLQFSDRELSDVRFRHEANVELAARIAEGISPACRTARSTSLMGVETASYVLWILSAGRGKCALDRAVSSIQLLKDDEKVGFTHHADALRALGLCYKADPTDFVKKDKQDDLRLRLELPMQKFTYFVDGVRTGRRPVPDALKALLTHAAKTPLPSPDQAFENGKLAIKSPMNNSSETTARAVLPGKRKESPTAAISAKPKKPKKNAFNFLELGAKKAKAALTARKMARAGLDCRKTQTLLAHTGSQVPLSNVMRLKYTKGFTQAVRVPCRLEDLV